MPSKKKAKSAILTPKVDIIGKESGTYKFTLSNTDLDTSPSNNSALPSHPFNLGRRGLIIVSKNLFVFPTIKMVNHY